MTTRKIRRPHLHSDKVSDYNPPPLDHTIFNHLYECLRVVLYHGNLRGTARALSISPRTAYAWINRPPRDSHANLVLRHVIREKIRFCEHHKHRAMRDRALEAKNYMVKYCRESFHPTEDHAVELDEDLALDETAARFVLEIVAQYGYISSADFRKGRYSKFTPRMYRNAAEQLCLDKTTRGFGDSKETLYSLPGAQLPEPDYTDSRSYKLYVNRVKRL